MKNSGGCDPIINTYTRSFNLWTNAASRAREKGEADGLSISVIIHGSQASANRGV